jgi:hypothetical protein
MNEHNDFINLDIKGLSKKSRNPLIFVDCWNLYGKVNFTNIDNIIYCGIGLY